VGASPAVATGPAVTAPTREAIVELRPTRMGNARRPCAIGVVGFSPMPRALLVRGDLVDRGTWSTWFLQTALLVVIGTVVAVAGAALGITRAATDDVAAMVAVGGLALGVALFVWGTARSVRGPTRLAAPGELTIPYDRLTGIDAAGRVVRLTARWYPQDRGPVVGTFTAPEPQVAAAFCTAVFVARARAARDAPMPAPEPVA
jgi:hypothetical protein